MYLQWTGGVYKQIKQIFQLKWATYNNMVSISGILKHKETVKTSIFALLAQTRKRIEIKDENETGNARPVWETALTAAMQLKVVVEIKPTFKITKSKVFCCNIKKI